MDRMEKSVLTNLERDEVLTRIAKQHCRFETLKTRKRDSLDFREVSVWGLKAALEEAFAAGQVHQRALSIDTDKQRIIHSGQDTGKKSSVLTQIRVAAKEPKEPRRDKSTRKRHEPER